MKLHPQFRFLLTAGLILALVLGTVPLRGAQDAAKSAKSKPAAKSSAPTGSTASAAQPFDAGYTAKIKEYTTDPQFLTELVDHLPASDKVPTPEKILGYVVGTPEKLTYTKDIFRYYRELAKSSPRVQLWTVGKSEEGREMLLIAVSDEANLAQLDRYKQITARLADPRKITDADAQQLVGEGKPFYSLRLHSFPRDRLPGNAHGVHLSSGR